MGGPNSHRSTAPTSHVHEPKQDAEISQCPGMAAEQEYCRVDRTGSGQGNQSQGSAQPEVRADTVQRTAPRAVDCSQTGVPECTRRTATSMSRWTRTRAPSVYFGGTTLEPERHTRCQGSDARREAARPPPLRLQDSLNSSLLDAVPGVWNPPRRLTVEQSTAVFGSARKLVRTSHRSVSCYVSRRKCSRANRGADRWHVSDRRISSRYDATRSKF